jgi:transcriptional regulator with XRE-family HTH domain
MSTLAVRTRIKTLRETKGISQSQMAEKLHMDERNYKRIESGEKKNMELDLLSRIAEVLEVDVPDLLASEVVNIFENDIHDNQNSPAGNGTGITNVNAFPDELKEAYQDMMQLMRELIEEKNSTIAAHEKIIALLQELRK